MMLKNTGAKERRDGEEISREVIVTKQKVKGEDQS